MERGSMPSAKYVHMRRKTIEVTKRRNTELQEEHGGTTEGAEKIENPLNY
jgi:hypothetical protein